MKTIVRQNLFPIVAFAALVILVIAGFRIAKASPSRSEVVDDTNGVTQASTDAWVDSTGTQWYYSKVLNLWITPVLPRPFFCHSGAAGAIALGLYSASALPCDTTSASAVGIAHPESTVIVGFRWFNKKGTSPTDTTIFFKTPTGASTSAALYKINWGGADFGSVYGLSIFVGASDLLEAYDKVKASGSVNPISPFVYLMQYRFRRPQ